MGRWRAWVAREPALAGLSWDRFCSELGGGDGHRQDELLTALAHIGRHDCDALGVVVVALAPGVQARIARHAPGLAADDAHSIANAGICAAIARGGLPDRFVASALLDAAKRHLRRAVEQESSWQCHIDGTVDGSDVPAPAVTGAGELSGALIVTTAVRAGVLTRTDAWLLHATVIEGLCVGDAARRLGLSYEATKKRRLRALARWRSWWDDPDWDRGGA
jgi:hypothetical protein